MKKIVFAIAFIWGIFLSTYAQTYLRYHMNNDKYHGFYTEHIESILHENKDETITSIIQVSGKKHEICINDIDSILIECASVQNGDLGQYRIYEFNKNVGDIKKIYVDNRASLFASKNGDFGANDTILFSSAYNGIEYLFFTDNHGRIKKFMDGNRLFFFDYESDNNFNVLDLSINKTEHFCFGQSKINKPSILAIRKKESFFSKFKECGFKDFMNGDVLLNRQANYISTFAENITDVSNDPELRNQILILDVLSLGMDMIEIGAAIFAEGASFGLTTVKLIESTTSLMDDLVNLMNRLYPDNEQMDKYREYYRSRYGITIKTIQAENIQSDNANLRGTFTATNGINGNLYFTISKLADTGIGTRIEGTTELITSHSYTVTGDVSNLSPETCYFYTLWYECDIDGLHFTFPSDNGMEFTTLGQVDFDDLFVGMNCLKSLYDSTNGDCWTDNTGWFTDNNVRNWHGIEIDSTCLSYNNKSIIKLQLPNNNLSGRLNLYECKGISEMDLSGNPISHFNITPLSSNGEGHGYHDLQALNMPGNGENVYLNASCCRNLRISAENNEIGTYSTPRFSTGG